MKITTTLQPETVQAMLKLDSKCVDAHSARLGFDQGEPLLLCVDGLLRYAKAHKARWESPLSEDYMLGPCWLDAIKAIHGLMDGDGAVALERGITTDSKCNGMLEDVYWAARNAAGFADETEVA